MIYILCMTTNAIYGLSGAGETQLARAFDVTTRRGNYAGLIVETYGRGVKVFWNDTATRGSARNFSSIPDAIEFLHQRRLRRGFTVA